MKTKGRRNRLTKQKPLSCAKVQNARAQFRLFGAPGSLSAPVVRGPYRGNGWSAKIPRLETRRRRLLAPNFAALSRRSGWIMANAFVTRGEAPSEFDLT
jgi:hypothetical protein